MKYSLQYAKEMRINSEQYSEEMKIYDRYNEQSKLKTGPEPGPEPGPETGPETGPESGPETGETSNK